MKTKILLICFSVLFLFSGYKVLSIINDYNTSKNNYENLSETYTVENNITPIPTLIPTITDVPIFTLRPTSVPDKPILELIFVKNEETPELTPIITPIIAQPTPTEEVKEEYPFKNIDFEGLTEINSDIVGWITIPDTNIDYPIVQSHDNNEYLKLSFEKEYDSAGTLFTDVRNDGIDDFVTVIYGHNLKSGIMFSQLRKYQETSFYEDHKTFEIYTPEGSYVYNIISAYATNKYDECYSPGIDDKTIYKQWLNNVVKRSELEGMEASVDKNTIVLSTCNGGAGSDKRWVVLLQKAD